MGRKLDLTHVHRSTYLKMTSGRARDTILSVHHWTIFDQAIQHGQCIARHNDRNIPIFGKDLNTLVKFLIPVRVVGEGEEFSCQLACDIVRSL